MFRFFYSYSCVNSIINGQTQSYNSYNTYYYVKNYSFIQDVKIFFLTIKIVLSKEGADAGKNTIQTELETLIEHEKEYEKQKNNIQGEIKNV